MVACLIHEMGNCMYGKIFFVHKWIKTLPNTQNTKCYFILNLQKVTDIQIAESMNWWGNFVFFSFWDLPSHLCDIKFFAKCFICIENYSYL